MSSKRWFFSFISMVILTAVIVAAINAAVDPFGVFGDHFFDWYSFNFTNNPRVAKIAYLDKHHREFDSYIIGSSTTSAYSADKLNSYTGDKFYNLFMYGCDLYDVAKTANYIIDNYEVKNIVMPIGLREMVKYNFEDHFLTDNLHTRVDGGSPYLFYLKYLYANPKYSANKINDYINDSYLPKKFDVFLERTGAYDKAVRDVEPISDMEKYFEDYPDFNGYGYARQEMKYAEECLAKISEIKTKCDAKGIGLTLIFSPEYYMQKDFYDSEELKNFWIRLAEITDFWDFSFTGISTDARYFYDATHIRNTLGDMILARIFNDDSIYRPYDLGYYVNKENVRERIAFFDYDIEGITDNSARVPILSCSPASAEEFEEVIRTLKYSGYSAITFSNLCDYVNLGIDMPEKPIIITIDNFSKENSGFIYDVLSRYNFKGVLFLNDRDRSLMNLARELRPVISAEIRSDDFAGSRVDYPKEEEIRYINGYRRDINKLISVFYENFDEFPQAFLYNEDEYSILNDVLTKNAGIPITISMDSSKINTIVKGLPQSLNALNRIVPDSDLSVTEVLEGIE